MIQKVSVITGAMGCEIKLAVKVGDRRYWRTVAACLITDESERVPKGIFRVKPKGDGRTAEVTPGFVLRDAKEKLLFKTDFKWQVPFPHNPSDYAPRIS